MIFTKFRCSPFPIFQCNKTDSKNVLVINSGSSSVKFQLFKMPDEKLLGSGKFEKANDGKGIFNYRFEKREVKRRSGNFNYKTGIHEISELKSSNVFGKETIISSLDSKVSVVVIPTNEELMIARDIYQMAISK